MHKIHYPMNLLVIILLTGCITGSCSGSLRQQPDPEYWPTQNWQSTTPEAQGMDSTILAQMFETVQKDNIRLHSLLIVRNGYLVVEAYWHPYGPDVKHSIESNTKSIIGTLVGIAMDQGKLQNVHQKLVDFFPERSIQDMDEQKKSISLQNLLSMTPGLDCQDQSSAATEMYQAEDWVQYLLDLPVVSPPGKRWIYCSGAVHLLSAVLQKSTGLDARTYANTYLFEPLGIPEVQAQDWGTDSQGVNNGIAGLYLTPRDLAKFGYLYLNKGRWEGRQVVSAHWVEESTREQAYIGKDDYVGGLDRRFGYLWSIFPKLKYYGYLGMAGQELFILPEKNMVVVFTGSLQVGKEATLLKLINDYIVPAAHSKDAISPDPQAASKLETLIQAAQGPGLPVPPLPQTAFDITGKTFILDQNPLGWQDMTFFFQAGSDEAILRMSGSPEMKIGLDNRYRLTETPGNRSMGLRGRWEKSVEFYLDFIIQGDFIESVGHFNFDGSQITMTFTNLNYGGPPMILHGSIIK